MTWTPQQLAELHAEAARKQRMEDEGVDPGNPAEREAWEAGYDAALADAERILDAWYDRYRRASRIDEDVFLALRNRLIPLEPGTPVQFQYRFQRRWLNGTYDGPAENPDDPNRDGDAWVIRDGGSYPKRVQVFFSRIRRRP